MRHEELLRKIIKEQVFELFQINESFDRPFSNINKIDDYTYEVNENGVTGLFVFRREHNNNTLSRYDFYSDKIDLYYDVSWWWGRNMNNELKTASNWVRMTATAFKIMDDFIRTMNPAAIKISRKTKGNKKIYFNPIFVDQLRTLFGQNFDVFDYANYDRIFLVNKEVSRMQDDVINKLTECVGFENAWKSVKYPKKRNEWGIVRNDTIKEQRKRILYMAKYL